MGSRVDAGCSQKTEHVFWIAADTRVLGVDRGLAHGSEVWFLGAEMGAKLGSGKLEGLFPQSMAVSIIRAHLQAAPQEE